MDVLQHQKAPKMFQASHEKNQKRNKNNRSSVKQAEQQQQNLPVLLIHLNLQGQGPQQGTDQEEDPTAQKRPFSVHVSHLRSD